MNDRSAGVRPSSFVFGHTTLALATTAVTLAPMPGHARQLVLTRRPGRWLAARRFLRRRDVRLVRVGVLSPLRLIRPVWRRVAAWRDARHAARIGGALRRGIEIVDRQIGQDQGGVIHPATQPFGARLPVTRFLGP